MGIENKIWTKNYVVISALLFTLYAFLIPNFGHDYDRYCWISWSTYSFTNGLSQIYSSGTDYLPLYHYVLWAYGNIMGSPERIIENIAYLKLFTLLFHFITGFFILRIVSAFTNNSYQLLFQVLFYLLNIFILFNTLVWGQVDAIFTSFAFMSMYFAYKKKILITLLVFVLAINTKLQAIIFLPLIGLLLIPELIRLFNWKKLAGWILLPLGLQVLILLPFLNYDTLISIKSVVLSSFGRYPFVSMNAFNIWEILVPGNLMEKYDADIFIGLSYHTWGLGLFFIFSAIALFPLAKASYLAVVHKTQLIFPIEKVLLIFSIIPLLFFYVCTEMHERYSHPAFAFLITYAIIAKKPWPAVLATFAYFLNLEKVLRYFQFANCETFLFRNNTISVMFLIVIVWLYLRLYDVKFSLPRIRRKASITQV